MNIKIIEEVAKKEKECITIGREVRVISNVDEYKYDSSILSITKDGTTSLISLVDYMSEDFSLGENPPKEEHRVLEVFVMNENGLTIDRIR